MLGAAVMAPPPMAVPVPAPAPALGEEVLKAKKPYTSSNPRYCWTKLEHDKFVEALQL